MMIQKIKLKSKFKPTHPPGGKGKNMTEKDGMAMIRKHLTNYLFGIFIPVDFVAEGLAQIIC